MRLSWAKKVVIISEAVVQLGYARLILHRTRPFHIIARNSAAKFSSGFSKAIEEKYCVEISVIVTRLARKLPWRADCLVQAIAAQCMLKRRGVASTITVGTTKRFNGTFEAHAWLSCGDSIVIGGDIVRFAPLLEYPAQDGISS